MVRSSVVIVVASLAFGACSSSKSAERPVTERQLSDYFPLHLGDGWTYLAVSGPRKDSLRYDVVEQPEPRVFVMQVKPGSEQSPSAPHKVGKARMESRPRGIFDGTRYVLQEPLEVGTKWTAILDARTAEHFEIIAVNVETSVPAGKFADCIVVRSAIKEPGEVTQLSDATYCKGVGMVESIVTVAKPGKPTLTLGHLQLTVFESGGQRVFPKRLGE